jgi:hypothetical protein
MKLALGLTLALATACASTTASSTAAAPAQKLDAQACSPLVPAVAIQGADVYATPDTSLAPIATLSARSQVCAASTSQGFGLSRVKLADGRMGFTDETNLSF